MDRLSVLVLVAILLLFGLIVYWMVLSARKEVARKPHMAAALGFAPAAAADPALLDQILSVSPRRDHAGRFELRNVYRKPFVDGELVIFDLVNTGGEEENQVENQTVAVISPELDMPHVMIFPQADTEGWATGLANRVMRAVVARSGDLLEFPGSPEFGSRYLLASDEPGAARQFFTPDVLRELAQTRYLTISAARGVFTLSSFDLSRKAFDQQSMSARVDQALRVFRILAGRR
jgi:hypothetical protein